MRVVRLTLHTQTHRTAPRTDQVKRNSAQTDQVKGKTDLLWGASCTVSCRKDHEQKRG